MFKLINATTNPEIVDPFWPNVVYFARYDGSNTTDLRGVCTPTVNGTLTNNTTTRQFGSASLQKASGANWLILAGANNTIFTFGTGNFTIEMWIRFATVPNTNNHALISLNQNLNQINGGIDGLTVQGVTSPTPGYRMFWYDGNPNPVQLYFFGTNTNNNAAGSPLLVTNTWHHIGVCRQGTNLYTFANGRVNLNATNYNKNIANTIGGTLLGTDRYSQHNYPMFFDDVRITRGVARYTNPTLGYPVPTKSWPTPTLP
jgi:hypothetical protein